MVMIIIHIAYITYLVTNDGWHAYDVIGVYKIHLRAGGISYFAEPAILRMVGTVMGEVGAHNPGGMPPGQAAKTIEYIYILYLLINRRR